MQPNIPYLLAIFVIAVLAAVFRVICQNGFISNWRQLRKNAAGVEPADSNQVLAQVSLRPAELAYLLHGGDMSNVMAVLVFDLLHRAVKGGTNLPLTDYEERILSKIKEYVTRTAQQEVSKVLPDIQADSLWQIVSKLRSIYGFLMLTVREFLGQVLADPRRLKRYFSVAGLLKLLADLGGAGYQQLVRVEMSAHLISQGWLQAESQRQAESRLLFIISWSLLAVLLISTFTTVGNVGLSAAILLVSALLAVLLRLLWSALDFLPYYNEIKEILKYLKRPGWRLPVLKLIVNLIGFVALGTTAGLTLLGLLAGTVFLSWYFQLTVPNVLLLLLPMMAVLILLLDAFFACHHLRWNAQVSPYARAIIKQYRHKLSHQSPLIVFRELLLSDRYDPLFSELLAVYGIEMLILLA